MDAKKRFFDALYAADDSSGESGSEADITSAPPPKKFRRSANPMDSFNTPSARRENSDTKVQEAKQEGGSKIHGEKPLTRIKPASRENIDSEASEAKPDEGRQIRVRRARLQAKSIRSESSVSNVHEIEQQERTRNVSRKPCSPAILPDSALYDLTTDDDDDDNDDDENDNDDDDDDLDLPLQAASRKPHPPATPPNAALYDLTTDEDDDDLDLPLRAFARTAAHLITKSPSPPTQARTQKIKRALPSLEPKTSEAPQTKKRALLSLEPRMSEVSQTKKRKLPSLDPIMSEAPKTEKCKPDIQQTTLPEHLHIFKGLVFYYHPNSDESTLRKFQVQKAAERGATPALQFDASVTHVIVDYDCEYEEVLEDLNRDSLPDGVALVNDHYVPECIRFGYLLDPERLLFRIHRRKPIARGADPKGKPATPNWQRSHTTSRESEVTPDPEMEPTSKMPLKKGSEISPLPKSSGLADLEAAIEEEGRFSQLPLEELSDDINSNARPTSSKAKFQPKGSSWRDKFQCMRAHTTSTSKTGPNASTIEVLQQMRAYYERTNDKWRVLAYQRACTALSHCTEKITTKKAALKLPGIGDRLADKIAEIAATDSLRLLSAVQDDPRDAARRLFMGIYGAGPAQAEAWIARGYRTLADLECHADLSTTQQIGIAHHADFAARIPRAEVEQHIEIVRSMLAKLDTRVEMTVGGSFRRGAATCGDIDFLIIGPEAMPRHVLELLIFERLVPALFNAGYLQCALAASSAEGSGRGARSKWHGAAALPGGVGGVSDGSSSTGANRVWRRVDFLLVPGAERGAALLYFTGSALFNRSMRLLARRRGMRLNQRGLWRVSGRPVVIPPSDAEEGAIGDDEDEEEDGLLEARCEKRIFELLEVPWREPHERNC